MNKTMNMLIAIVPHPQPHPATCSTVAKSKMLNNTELQEASLVSESRMTC